MNEELKTISGIMNCLSLNVNRVTIHGEVWMRHPVHFQYFGSATGRIYSSKRSKMLSFSLIRDGYNQVHLNRKHILAHRFIYETFSQQLIPDKMQVDHVDGCKTNNAISNLALLTPSENSTKAHRIDKSQDGNRSRLNARWIHAIKENGNTIGFYPSARYASRVVGVYHPKILEYAKTPTSTAFSRKLNQRIKFKIFHEEDVPLDIRLRFYKPSSSSKQSIKRKQDWTCNDCGKTLTFGSQYAHRKTCRGNV